jgi:trimeric autotransporter adhesin
MAIIRGKALRDILLGTALADQIYGLAGNDDLYGGLGNDLLDGGTGADKLYGGGGNDTYVIDNIGDVVGEAANQGVDLVQSSVTHKLGLNFENLTLTGVAAINGTGNTLVNILTGNAAANILDGGAGADKMYGGLGNDTYIVDNAGDVVTELANQGTDTVQSSVSHTLTANVENLTLTGTAAINGSGNSLANILTGNAAANILDGGAGADKMSGGLGNDTYVVDNAGDVVTELANQGTDLVKASITYALTANVENLTLLGSAAINGTGNTLGNVITGNSAANILNGGTGADHLYGGAGNDIYIVDNIGDVVSEAANQGIDLIQSSISITLGANVENLTLTGLDNINGGGNDLDNTITGNAGSNTLNGGLGADRLFGGAGNDWISIGAGDILADGGTGYDTVFMQFGATFRTQLVSIEAVTGTWGDDVIDLSAYGTGFAIWAGGGNDIVRASHGNDSIDGTNGTTLIEFSGARYDYKVTVDAAGATHVTDLRSSGDGDDIVKNITTFRFTNGDWDSGHMIPGGWGEITVLGNYLVGTNSDDTIDGREGGDNISGGGGNDTLIGGDGNDSLDGGAGADFLFGGAGDDTFFADGNDIISDTSGVDQIFVYASSFTLGQGIENLSSSFTGGFDGTGNDLDNIITSGSGNDRLDGGLGADHLNGGDGNDIYIVDNAGDVITDTSGNDTILTALATYALGNGIENLTYTGTEGFSGDGNGLDNIITGGAGNDALNGGLGADQLIGGGGNDSYLIDNAGDVVTDTSGTDTIYTTLNSLVLASGVENLTFIGSGNFSGTGNDLHNVILGGDGSDVLNGDAGNDTLDGGAGADQLSGGDGNDTYVVDNALDQVFESLGQGTDTIQSSVTFALSANVENLVLLGADNIDGTGNDLNNIITGNAGDNVLNGGAGYDQLYGGDGNDTYIVDTFYDFITDSSGIDTIVLTQATATSLFFLGAYADIENLTFVGSDNVHLYGSSSNNVLEGGAGSDTLSGENGNDTLIGGEGNDWLYGNLAAHYYYIEYHRQLAINPLSNPAPYQTDVGDDIFKGGAGNDWIFLSHAGDTVIEFAGEGTDTVFSSFSYTLGDNVENLSLEGLDAANTTGTGNALNNTIYGDGGANILDGLTGSDTLSGSSGDDHFVIHNEPGSPDAITDFRRNDDLDLLRFSAAEFAGIGPIVENVNFFSVSHYTISTASGPEFIYATATNELYFDSDGAGSDPATLIANLTDPLYGSSVFLRANDFERIA